ncbi:MAG: tRNA (guanosine(46)-N7)-methyltransferase TrmB [Clostridia bacterium]|jgi:tRNA (guanine-N7-)-methyltransferase|nr:tRNA (guanosine(46)-N7)-methyltransferase TrmB [Clostridia bacterium]MBQ4365990.1 tRNA (guanosine(46)-N7)-methyltransferase TrmB [Clostridia bacterium]
MRMRRKKNLDERLRRVADCLVDIGETEGGYQGLPFCAEKLDLVGLFGNAHPVELEIGCGKGQFAAAIAAKHPERNFLAVEVNPNVVVQACEKAQAAGLKNLRFLLLGAEKLGVLLPEGSIGRIYLNFSTPFPKKRQAKRRLTHDSFLQIYRAILTDGGEILQKTDNRILFASSICAFSRCGFELSDVTLDLHADEPEDNVMTEYESRFVSLGQPIFALKATKR